MTTRDTPTAGTPSDLGASVLELLATQGKPMGVRDIVRRLGLDAPGRHELKEVLRRLIADGQLVKIHGARVGLPDRMNLVVGRLTANPAGFGFVVPDKPAGAPRTREGDVYVSAVNMKEALHGDRVVARVERHTPNGPEGRIIRALGPDRLAGGGWKLAVHIADVAHYVRPGSALDQEAYLRGTSVYFPDRVVPMLPHALSSGICSLVENQDRLTQTVVLELDAKARVRKAEFHDGVIKSRARMTYQQVQRIVDGDAELRRQFAPLVPLFERMDELAKLMRRRRYERGSLDFDLPEPKLVLDEAGQMTGIVADARLDSMRSIEEFMLAANEAVAERLDRAGTPTLYRIHEQPDPERVEEFAELVSSFGYRLPAKLEEVRPQDFQGILRQVEGKPEEKLISYLLLRTMRLARYHEENLGHFGLATEMYAHFTSPIRRYAELVVHRSLRALRHGQGADVARDLPAPLAEMAKHLSDMERRATDAERELIEWKKVRFMADKLGEVFSGYVTGVQSFGLFVELDEIYVQGLVHVSSMTDEYYPFDERAHMLKGENTGKVYRLVGPVKS